MGIKIITKKKDAHYEFFIHEKVEAGIALQGTEVKSLRLGKASIEEAFITIDRGEAWVHKMSIPEYAFGNISNHKIDRKRKLLLHSEEIKKLEHNIQAKGLTIIPVALYFKESLVKLEIALAKGKKLYDKRDSEAKKDVERQLRRQNFD